MQTMRCEWNQRLKTSLVVVVIAMMAVACGNGDSPEAPAETAESSAESTVIHGTPQVLSSPTPVGPPPEPADVDFSSLQIIEEWRAAQVPSYPDAEFIEFNPEAATETENAGIMFFMTDDSPEDVLAFYRAALLHLGWDETTANARQISASSDVAGLTIGVSNSEGPTNILMILSDPLRS